MTKLPAGPPLTHSDILPGGWRRRPRWESAGWLPSHHGPTRGQQSAAAATPNGVRMGPIPPKARAWCVSASNLAGAAARGGDRDTSWR